MTKAILALADGWYCEGKSYGAKGETSGEVVFNTAMTGYQEILTDPSYKGQIVLMTYPEIGNYGVNEEDAESRSPFVEGFIVREGSSRTSNWRSQNSLESYLHSNNIIGIQEIDTRELTRHIRDNGAQTGVISTIDLDAKSVICKAQKSPGIIGVDLVKKVTCEKKYLWIDDIQTYLKAKNNNSVERKKYKVAVCDLGVKYNILRKLTEFGCDLTVYPANTPSEEILRTSPDGVFLSNGPGDPEGVPYVINSVKNLLGKIPIFGICLGHQVISLATGGKTYKLKFGHHGANHPVKNLQNNSIEITSQNHGFCVEYESLLEKNANITHINLNDKTVEGLENIEKGYFSVQYHPEASPGPHDSHYLFKRYIELMESWHAPSY